MFCATHLQTASSRARAALHAKWGEVVSDRTYRQLWFDFRHITDELVFYGMKAQTSHFVSPLANLFYKMLFHHEAFAMFLSAPQRGHRRMPSVSGSEPKARDESRALPVVCLCFSSVHK